MEKVTGIGGFFFRSDNPEELANWYEEHLGINPVPSDYGQTSWVQEKGSTVFAPFERNTKYFGKESQMWMINFRVEDLSKMVKQLQNAGIEVSVDEQEYPNGKFASLQDLEGNPIQLWEPKD